MELLRPKLIVDRHALFPFQKKSLELGTGKTHSILYIQLPSCNE